MSDVFITAEDLAALVTDSNMTSDAVRVVLFLASLGPSGEERDVKGEDIAILIHRGEKPVRAAIKRAEHCGYLAARHGGRAGHKLTLLVGLNDSPRGGIKKETTPPGEGLTVNDSPRGGITGAPTTTPTTPTPTEARAPEADLQKLREHLGPHADAVDLMDRSAEHTPMWASAVYGTYGPAGTQARIYQNLPTERRPAVLATVLTEYATNGKPFSNKYFAGYFQEAVKNERNPKAGNSSDNSGASDSSAGTPAGDSAPKKRGKYADLYQSTGASGS